MQTATIKGRSYQITHVVEAGPLASRDMLARGWEPRNYLLTGKRGATVVAMRTLRGIFVAVRS
jgi:hypothetical protein